MFWQRKWLAALAALTILCLALGGRQILAEGPAPTGAANVDSEGRETAVSPPITYADPVEEAEALADTQAPTATYFKHYPGTAFQPRDSDTGYDYFGNGCISSQGAAYFILNMQLPPGAEIDFVRLYFYDTSTADARLYLTWYDSAGNYSDVVYVDSSGTSGYGSAGAFTSYTVDPITQSINLVWRPNTPGASMALCGARIRYQAPFSASFLPAVLNETGAE